MAQVGSYLGPGILTRGAGDIGDKSGQQVDLRFFVNLEGVYDNGIQPFAVDSKGNLIQVNGLYGEQLDLGAYGTHRWKTGVLGLNYTGDFYNYNNNSSYDGSSHNLTLGYTYQKSRRLSFDFRELAGTTNLGYGSPGYYGNTTIGTDLVNTPTSILFDNRMYYLQSTMDANFIVTNRTIFTVGGDGFLVRRSAVGLAGAQGYNLRGTIQHRLTKTRTIGATYQHMHMDFPPAFGQSDVNLAEGIFALEIGKHGSLTLHAGAFQAEVQGVQQIALNPVIAALLGTSTGQQAFYKENIYPSGTGLFTYRFHTSALSFGGGQTVTPGNGLYLTSRETDATGYYSYTGIHQWNFGVSGGYSALAGIGQTLQPYSSFIGGAGFTYNLTRAIHLVGRYDSRHQQITYAGLRAYGSRATFGFSFSPGDVPLSLW